MDTKSITCAILAGGKSRRFGKNKLLLEYKGKSFLQLTIDKLSEISKEIIIAGRNFEEIQACTYKYKCFKDDYILKASIVGIHTALKYSNNDMVLVVAGDLPLLKSEVLKLLVSKYISCNCEAVIPVVRGFIEPLVALYSRKTLDIIEENIENNKLKIADFIKKIDIYKLSEKEIKVVDPELVSFFNINTKEDYSKLLKMGEEIGGQIFIIDK